MSNYFLRVGGVVAFFCVVASQASGLEADWIGGPAGTWFDPANWSTGVVPNVATTNVTIDNNTLEDSVVVLGQNATVGSLWIDSGDALNLDTGRVLTASSATIAGSVNFAPSSRLQLGNSLWVQEGGLLSLVDTSQIVDTTSPFYVLWNEGSIEGAGQISNTSFGAVLNNDGTVLANVPGKQLYVGLYGTANRGVHFNEGELLAENGGTLRIFGKGDPPAFFTPLDNSNGTIEARGDSTVFLQKIRLVGGQLSTSSVGGTSEGLISLGSVMFENVTLEGNLLLNSVTFSDKVVNNTDIQVDSFFVEGYATITGDGSMDLNGGSVNIPGTQFGGQFVGTPGFVNDVEHTLIGPGTISSSLSSNRLAFENRGVIETAEGTLQINLRAASQLPSSMAQTVNSGKIRAKTGGRVEILGSSFSDVLNNSAGATMGVIEAGVDSTVVLGNMTLRGGILRPVAPPEGSTAQAGKILKTGNGPLLEDIRIEGKIGDTLANSGFGLAGTIENTGVMAPGFVIYKPTTLTGGGEIHLQNPGGIVGNRANFDGFYDPLVNEDNLIRGGGSIGDGLAFINRGVVQSDVNNGTLTIVANSQFGTIESHPVINSGELKAINGGDLVIDAPVVNYEDSDLGTIHAGDGSEVPVSKITGGILSTEGSGTIVTTSINGASYLADVLNMGKLVVGTQTEVRGRMTNDGAVSQITGNKVYVGGPFTELAGSGTWGTSNIPLSLEVGTSIPSAGIFVHGAQHTLQGGGTINVVRGTFVNRGTVLSNGNAPLTIALAQGATMQQQGTLQVAAFRTIEIAINDERFTNRGIIADNNGTFQLKRLNSGPVELINAPGAEIHIESIFNISAQSSVSNSVKLWNQQGALLSGSGKLNLIQSVPNQQAVLRNSGIIRLESDTSIFGRIFLDGEFVQDSTGLLDLGLSGSDTTGEFDSLRVSRNVTLDGALNVSVVGFEPNVGDSFQIVKTSGGVLNGAFATFSAPALAGRWWSLNYLTDMVVLEVAAITADFNLDGFVDGNDLDDWQLAHQAGSSAADADGDGDSDGRDFLAWQQQYGSGVPVGGLSAAVPEPGTAILLLTLSSVLAVRRRAALA